MSGPPCQSCMPRTARVVSGSCTRRYGADKKMEWMCVNGRFQNRRITSQKGGEAGPAATRPSSAQTS